MDIGFVGRAIESFEVDTSNLFTNARQTNNAQTEDKIIRDEAPAQ